MKKTVKKILTLITCGTMAVVLAACYGVPVEEEYYRLVKTKNGNGEPIPNLKVTLLQNEQELQNQQTDVEGTVVFNNLDANKNYSVLIEDIDGQDNKGEFENKKVDVTEVIDTEVTMKTKESL